MITRRTTFRLYPTRTQEKRVFSWRRLHCLLYNAAIVNRRTQYQKFGHSVSYYEQQNCLPQFKKVWIEYQDINSQALQATLKRVDLAYLIQEINNKQQQQQSIFFTQCNYNSLQKLVFTM